jgi:hypothetical protein
MKGILVTILTGACIAVGVAAHAKIPAPPATPEQEAKAADVKAKAAEAAKKQAELLGKAQDRAADNYKKGKAIASSGATPAKK